MRSTTHPDAAPTDRSGAMHPQQGLNPANPVSIPVSMSAVVQDAYGDVDVLQLESVAVPVPAADEVLVRVRAAGLSRGTWHLMTGRPLLMRILGFGFRAPKQRVLGQDLAGTVVGVGAAVTRFAVGDEVYGIGRGSFAGYAVAAEDKLAPVSAALTAPQAAVAPVSALTALQSLRDAGRLQPGQHVLVLGASGGVGSFAVQIAKALGAEVTGVCSAGKVDLVRSLGADHVLDYAAQDVVDGSVRYDLILDIGGNTPLRRLRRALTPTGRLVFVGGENGGDWTAGFGRQLGAFALAPFVKQRFIMLMNKEHYSGLERLAALVLEGKLRPLIDRRIGLAAVPDALRALEAGEVSGKVAIEVA